jgi:rhodanese-related sulfurtransferase
MNAFLLFMFACGPIMEKVEILPGTPPDFSMPSDSYAFIPIAEVIEAYENEARFVLIDARPTVDYNLRHITGAYSVPFYEANEHVDRFPLDEWYVTYCACPHSESGIVAQALMDDGHQTVGIIDEGYLEWEALGYPTTEGEDRE